MTKAGPAAVAVLLLLAPLGAQQATFRSSVNYVEVDVIVTDANGKFVRGLTASDFLLKERGKPQAIEVFNEISSPLAAAVRTPSAAVSDVITNARAADGRVFLIVLDDMHVAPASTARVRQLARAFVEKHVGPADFAAVVHTSGRVPNQDFSANHARLLASIDAFSGHGLRPAVINKMEDFLLRQGRRSEGDPPKDDDERDRLVRAADTYKVIGKLADGLAASPGRRKAMVMFSEGPALEAEAIGDPTRTSHGDMHTVRASMAEAMAAAARANLHLYTIDPSGLGGAVTPIQTLMPMATVGDSSGVTPSDTNPNAVQVTPQALQHEQRLARATLRDLAEGSGGASFADTNDFGSAFSQIEEENSAYYLLGFYSSNTAADGKFHPIDLEVARPGVKVRARRGYYSPRPASAGGARTPRDPLAALMQAALPAAGFPLRIAAPAFRKGTIVTVETSPDVFGFEGAGNARSEDLAALYDIADAKGTSVSSASQSIELRVKPETAEQIGRDGFRWMFSLDLPPGKYRARFAARTANAGRQGSVFADIEVPDFSAPLALSGVSMTSVAANAIPTRPLDQRAGTLVPLPPSAVRRFAASDTVAAYVEAYDNDASAPHTVELSAVVRDAKGKTVFSRVEEHAREKSPGFGFRIDVPPNRLAPGHYVLTFSAASSRARGKIVWRDVPFEIF